MKTTVTKQQMLCAMVFASADAHHAMSNVRVTNRILEATDGKILIRVERGASAEDNNHELATDAMFIDSKSSARWLKAIPKKSPPQVTIDHERTDVMGAPTIAMHRETGAAERKKAPSITAETLTVQNPEWSGTAQRCAIAWPNTDAVWDGASKAAPEASVVLSADIIARLAKAIKALGGDAVRLDIGGSCDVGRAFA